MLLGHHTRRFQCGLADSVVCVVGKGCVTGQGTKVVHHVRSGGGFGDDTHAVLNRPRKNDLCRCTRRFSGDLCHCRVVEYGGGIDLFFNVS